MSDPFFPVSENGTKYRIVFLEGDPRFDSREPDDYACDIGKCKRPATYKDDFSQWCDVHEPWPVEVADA